MQMMKNFMYYKVTLQMVWIMLWKKFGRYVLQMEFTMLEVSKRRKGKQQNPRK